MFSIQFHSPRNAPISVPLFGFAAAFPDHREKEIFYKGKKDSAVVVLLRLGLPRAGWMMTRSLFPVRPEEDCPILSFLSLEYCCNCTQKDEELGRPQRDLCPVSLTVWKHF